MQTITKQEEIGDILMSLGINRTEASALAYMQDGNEATRTKLEIATRLRQPEVSIVMMRLKERGWIKERDETLPGKGRPRKVYSLATSFKDIITQLEEEQKKTADEAQARIKRLRGLKP